ncbi:YARHG domain-containing protein [Treponema zioleckii]|uniref:YARHG domain-containing protein n=1 Tax=Treponema zioleckii TaxID=331680 RepID=UPI00168B3BB6|nr:YARHG domain-containing protein [Treponema zioleckii]
MKKLFLIFAALFVLSSVAWADEFFKCRKETYIYNYKYAVHRGEEYSEEFYFINNFMIYEYQNGLTVFYKNEKGDYYRVFGNYGNYHPDYLGDGIFSAAKYDFNEPPKANIKNVEEIKYRKTDFYRILADEFYRWYLQNEAFNNSSYNPDFDCLAAFVEIAKIFSKEDLRILRNTIYAKYGYEFKSADLSEIFSKCDWYSPKESSAENVEKRFNRLESSLLEVIKLAEK